MKIQKRRVNSQDHTLGYKIGGKWYTRKQAIYLAKQGRVSDVSVCGSGRTQHLRGIQGFSLYGLDTQMV
jgi:hypothetical protein